MLLVTMFFLSLIFGGAALTRKPARVAPIRISR
jgi:hypothetical protein